MKEHIKCEECKFFPIISERVLCYGDNTPEIYFLLEHPPKNFDTDIILLERIKKELERDFKRIIKVRTGFILQCRSDKATTENLKGCMSRTLYDIQQHGNPVVITFGKKIPKLFGIKPKFRDVRGFSYRYKEIKFVATFDLPTLYANQNLFPEFKIDVLNALDDKLIKQDLEKNNFILPKTYEEVEEVANTIFALPPNIPIAVDIETNSLKAYLSTSKMISISFCWGERDEDTTSFPIFHKNAYYPKKTQLKILEIVERILLLPNPKIFQNGKFDVKYLEFKYGLKVVNFIYDTLLGEHSLDEHKKGYYSLKQIVKNYEPKYAQYEMDLDAKGIDNYETDIPMPRLLLYGAIDVKITRIIAMKQKVKINQQTATSIFRSDPRYRGLINVMPTIYIPMTRVLASMEYHGTKIDYNYLNKISPIASDKISELELELYSIYGRQFNINSPKQLALAIELICGLELPVSDKGNKETNKDVLKKLDKSDEKGFISKLLKFKKYTTLKNTFLKNILELSQDDGRIHTNFSLNGTSTGRLSSSAMNLQNIPEMMDKINVKNLFIPSSDDMILIEIDAKGAEVKTLTAYAPETNLIDAFIRGDFDPHSFFASEIYGIEYNLFKSIYRDEFHPLHKEYKELRQKAKVTVFAILYGVSKYGLVKQEAIKTVEEAEHFINLFFNKFPLIKRYMDEVFDEILIYGFCETYFGRRRRFPMVNLSGAFKGKAKRQAGNFKIQSTTVDLVHTAIASIYEDRHKLNIQPLLTVHDSFLFELPKKNVGYIPEFLNKHWTKLIENKFPWLPVDFTCDIKVGESYGTKVDIYKYLEGHPFIEEEYETIDEEDNDLPDDTIFDAIL